MFSRRAIVPEACSSWFLPRIVGIQTALEWTFSGRVFEASEALDRGFVRSVHAEDELLPAAKALAMEFSEMTSAVSVTLIRHMLWKMLGADHPMEAQDRFAGFTIEVVLPMPLKASSPFFKSERHLFLARSQGST